MAKNKIAKFDGNDFDPLTMLKSNLEHLNYQVADYKAKNENMIIGDNKMLMSEIERIRADEERNNYKD